MNKEQLLKIQKLVNSIIKDKNFKNRSTSLQFKFKQLLPIIATSMNLCKVVEDVPLDDIRLREEDDDIYVIFRLQHLNDISFIASWYVLMYKEESTPLEHIVALKEMFRFSVMTPDCTDVTKLEEFGIEHSCICNFDELLEKEIILIVEDTNNKINIGTYNVENLFSMFTNIWNRVNSNKESE